MRALVRPFAIALGFGAGLALVAVSTLAFISWQNNRPRPWNGSAVTATFDSIGVEGSENSLVFVYVLQNNTARDLHIPSETDVILNGRLQRQNSLVAQDKDVLTGEFPIFVPASGRTRTAIHLGYPYRGSEPLSGKPNTTARDDELLAAYVRDELTNLDGFVLFHNSTRYRIDLPNGWGTKK